MSSDAMRTLSKALLPEPTRELLRSLLGAFEAPFAPAIAATLAEFEREIFALADGARGADRQKHYFETVTDARRARTELAPALLAGIEDALARSTEPLAPLLLESRAANATGMEATEAKLLVTIAERAQGTFGIALGVLASRFARALGAPGFTVQTLPVGPYRLCEILERATAGFALHEHRALFYRVLDRHWHLALGAAYEQANVMLSGSTAPEYMPAQAPVVAAAEPVAVETTPVAAPVLTLAPIADRPAPESTPERERAPAPRTSTSGTTPALRLAPKASSPPPESLQSPLAGAPARVLSSTPFLRRGGPDLSGLKAPLIGWNLVGLPHLESVPDSVRGIRDQACREQYFRIREQQAALRRSHGGEAATRLAQSTHVARAEDIQMVLSFLHGAPAGSPQADGQVFARVFAGLRLDLINQLRQFTPDRKPPRLSDADFDVVDLVARLFDELVREVPSFGLAHAQLMELCVPVLRVALADKRFFTQPQHPVRQLLGVVVERALHWCGDEGDGPGNAVEQVRALGERLADCRNGTRQPEALLAEYVSLQRAALRRAELAERRLIDAASGRERLQSARAEADRAIETVLAATSPAPPLRKLLQQDWSRLLALTVLGEGPSSAAYRTRMAVAHRLASIFTVQQMWAAPVLPVDEQAMLTREVVGGLARVGYPVEEAQALVARLFSSGGAMIGEGKSVAPGPSMAFLQATTGVEIDVAPEAPRASPRVQMIATLLAAQASGAWIDMVSGPRGMVARRRISWISAKGERCLLVNQRGGRVDEVTLAWLASEIDAGRARVVPAESTGIVERAFEAIAARMEQQSGARTGSTLASA